MNFENKERSPNQNRLVGLLLIVAVIVVFCVWPPNEDYQHRRGAIELLRDFGMGGAATKIRLAVDWCLGIGVGLIESYQPVTGERVRRPEL